MSFDKGMKEPMDDEISLKLEHNIEFVHEDGRPDNFLGLHELSSCDLDNKFKYGCTEELEDALSSVHPVHSQTI